MIVIHFQLYFSKLTNFNLEFFVCTMLNKNSILIRRQRLDRQEELRNIYGHQKQIIYNELKNTGLYLPPINCPAVNRDYLKGIHNGEFLAVNIGKRNECDIPLWISKIELFLLLKESSELELGFGHRTAPSKKWMLTVLRTIKPDHQIFARPQEIEIPQDNDRNFHRQMTRLFNDLKQTQRNETARIKPLIKEELFQSIQKRMQDLENKYPFVILRDIN